MNSINEITAQQIGQLTPDQLSKLLHLLLQSEVLNNSIKNYEILAPEKINVADGGEDGRIKWEGEPEKTTWLKNRFSLFQTKATNLTPKKCYEEILERKIKGKKRKLKSQIKEVVENDGCYILFTFQELNTKQKNARITQFRRAIKDCKHKNHNTFEISIYDANQIKDWANENIAAVTYIQSCIGITRLTNFRTWNEWNNDMLGSQIKFQTNEILLNFVKQIRSVIKNDSVIRVIGHSGLGKTRLVLETFRENDANPEIKSLQSLLVYYDMGIGSLESISGYILSHKNHQSGIIVVDNCDEESHNVIAGLVRSSGSLKVITIDFASETAEKSRIILDRESQKDIVQKIVDAEFKETLTRTEKEFIANRSEGYPQMAIIFSESVLADGLTGLGETLPKEFIKKLVFGRDKESDFEFEIIKACSVMSSFGFIDNSIAADLTNQEKEFLTGQTNYVRIRICGQFHGKEISAKEFYKICIKYKAKNIMEQRGRRIMVKPTPLAINLAAAWWMETPENDIREILSELKDTDFGTRLVERLAELDQLDKAKEMVNELWGPKSPFGSAEVLNTSLGSLLFRYVVEVNPLATAKALDEAFGSMSKEEILKIEAGRRNLVWAMEKLCFRKESFNISARILYAFAVSENETWANNATNQFCQLFQLFLAGTEANLNERLDIIKWGLNKNDDSYTEVAIKAIGRGLKNDRYSRMGGAEKQGSSAPLEDYKPSWDEIIIYWKEILSILTDLSCSDQPYAELAKKQIAQCIRTLIRDGQFEILRNSILRIVDAKGKLWRDALNNLKVTVNIENQIPPETLEKVNKLIEQLTPTDLRSQLFLKVTKPEWDTFDKDESGSYIDKPKLSAEEFAAALIENKSSWTKHIADLLQGEQRQGFNFGAKYGALDPNIETTVEKVLSELKRINKDIQNPEFLAGLLYGADNRTLFAETIDKILNDASLRQHAFYLTRVIKPNYQDISKLFILVDKYDFDISYFQNFKYGRALDSLNANEVIELCDRIRKFGASGSWTALSLIYMYCHQREENWKSLKDFVRELIIGNNMIIDDHNTVKIDGYHWSDSVIKILSEGNEKKFAIIIAKQIIEFCSKMNFNYAFETYIKKVSDLLFEKYFDKVWDLFGMGLISEPLTSFHLENLLGAKKGFLNGGSGILFKNKANFTKVLKWCRANPEKAPKKIAHFMPLSISEDDKIKWNPFSLVLIDEFGDDDAFLQNLSANMGTFGSIGSTIPYYETQRELLEELTNHRHQKVRDWAKAKLEQTEKIIRREMLNDDEGIF